MWELTSHRKKLQCYELSQKASDHRFFFYFVHDPSKGKHRREENIESIAEKNIWTKKGGSELHNELHKLYY